MNTPSEEPARNAQAIGAKPGVFASSMPGTPAVSATGTNGADGVDASSDSGIGVSASSISGTGLVATSSKGQQAGHFLGPVGVLGESSTGGGVGVYGKSSTNAGVYGTSNSTAGVEGVGAIGVLGTSDSGDGVRGQIANTASSVAAVHGANLSGGGLAGLFDGNVKVDGTFTATGTKSFVQAHPTDPSREIVYVALEGGEAGTYMRGSGQLQSGKAVLALPEHFGLVTATEGLTIQLTPRGEWLQLYVVELDTAQLVVREAQGKSGAFDYLIHGVRRGYEQHEVIRPKR